MNKISRPLFISGVFSSILCITACTPKDHSAQNNGSEPKDVSQEILNQNQSQHIKVFANTPDDAHDIQLLNEYNQNYEDNMRSMDADIQQRSKDGNLTDEIRLQLKRDSIQSSLNMLKELDLKTEQGRYIQGLLYEYWEHQEHNQHEMKANTMDENKDAAEITENLDQAQNQLDFWQSKTDAT